MIESMKRVNLIAMKQDYEKVLKAVQAAGLVEIEHELDSELADFQTGQSIETAQNRLNDAKEAIEFVNNYHSEKKSIIAPKDPVTPKQLKEAGDNVEKFEQIFSQIRQLQSELMDHKANQIRLENEISTLAPYAHFDVPLDKLKFQKVRCCLGMAPVSENALPQEIGQSAYLEVIESTPTYTTLFFAARKSEFEQTLGLLKGVGFSEFYFGDMQGTIADNIEKLRKEIRESEQKAAEIAKRAREIAKEKKFLLLMEDYFSNELERAKAASELKETEKTVVLSGWLLAKRQSELEKTVRDVCPNCYLSLRDPLEEETPPTALKNNKVAEPFEGVIEMYSMPDPRGFDPSMVMALPYSIFFGVMMADVGYGIILSLLSLVLLKLKKPDGMFRKILGVVFIGGIFTTLFGFVFGGAFGFELKPLWINPQKDPLPMVVFCLAVGLLTIIYGLGVGAYIAFSRGKWVDAICDKIFWMILLAGLPMLVLGGTIAQIGTYMTLGALVAIILTGGRKKKGVVKKAVGGISSLYDIVSYLSDVLSFSRLFGMGLATGVIGMVFNTIAGMLTSSWIGYLFAAVVFAIGHVFNIGINALGAYVHSSRLMYIEFFPKFYEDGGRPFRPLAIRTKHFRVEKV